MLISALNTAQTGVRRQADAFHAAVEKVTDSMLDVESDAAVSTGPVPAPAPVADPGDALVTGLTDMMVAQRLFMTNLRALETADDMLEAAMQIGE